MSFEREIAARTAEAEGILRQWLPREEGYTRLLAEAMNYSLLAGGKRLRPVLMMETYRIFGGRGKVVEPFAAAMEMMHTHSLIHDDLPALDNDTLRRGKPTTHAAYGEALAILAGDALLNASYETIAKAFALPGSSTEHMIKAFGIFASHAGIDGMLGGQSVDVMNDGKPIDEPLLDYIYEYKTSALIEASMLIGAVLAGASEAEQEIICKAAQKIGLCFQIVDDILDVEGDEAVLGKPLHSDEKNQKVTYAALKGLAGAKAEAERLSAEAAELLRSLERDTGFLQQMVVWLQSRKG